MKTKIRIASFSTGFVDLDVGAATINFDSPKRKVAHSLVLDHYNAHLLFGLGHGGR